MKRFFCFLLTIPVILLMVSCDKTAMPGKKGKKVPMPEAVDIGLIVNGKNVKWASCNLGASKSYESGYYYAWGETLPKKEYYDDNYAHYNGKATQIIKYCREDIPEDWDSNSRPGGPDGLTVLQPKDDAAHVRLGGNWRMPTAEEFDALIALKEDNEHYLWEWGYEYDADHKQVYGLRITQKLTDNSVFFPEAGLWDGPYFSNLNTGGYYWSSTLGPTFQYMSISFDFDEGHDNSGHAYTGNWHRHNGLSIRPVYVE